MFRRLFTVLSVLSLLLCAATCMCWARSYWYADGFLDAERGTLRWQCVSLCGRMEFQWYRDPYQPGKSRNPQWSANKITDRRACELEPTWTSYDFKQWGGFAIDRSAMGVNDGTGWMMGGEAGGGWTSVEMITVSTPYWAFAVLMAILPAIFLLIYLRRRKIAARGCCPICGYDLRATPDRCPECGKKQSAVASLTGRMS